ncbi:MAG: hypothetical protein ACOC22_04655 [bacterium]
MINWKIKKGWEAANSGDLLYGYLDIIKAIKCLPRFEFWSYFNINRDAKYKRSLSLSYEEKVSIINELLDNWEEMND